MSGTLLVLLLPSANATSGGPRWVVDPGARVSGALSGAEIQGGLLTREAAVQACSAALAAQGGGAPGDLKASFTVLPTGVPSDLAVTGGADGASWFAGCVRGALDGARFASAEAPTTVAWTLRFDGGFDGAALAPLVSSTQTRVAGDGTDGAPTVEGSLDASLISLVVRRNMGQLRLCYQRELSRDPALAGRVVERFVIAADGTVREASAQSSTLNSPALEECLNGRFRKMVFPAPKGGGEVTVSYPFVFEPG